MIGGRLARATFEPDLVMTDGEAMFAGQRHAGRRAEGPSADRVVEPVPADVQRALDRPAPRDDGRQPDRPLRQPEHRLHRRLAQAQGAAARRAAGAPGNTINHTTSYWIPNHSPKRVRRARRRGVRASATTGRPRSGPSRRGSTDPPRRHQPGGARLRDAGPPDAPALGAPGGHGRRRWSRPPASSWSSPSPRRRLPTDEELRLIPRSSTRTTRARPRCGTDA